MRFIYAMGQPGDLNFVVAERSEAVPAGALLLAICNAEHTRENLDEILFSTMTDEEYYIFRALVSEAERLEAQPEKSRRMTIELPVERFLRWLRGESDSKSITF